MRSFTKMGPFSEIGYAEIPEEFTNDYFDDIYKHVDICVALNFGGYGLVKDEVLKHLVWTGLGSGRREAIENKEVQKKIAEGYELVKMVGFDVELIEKFSGSIKEEAERLSSQIDELMEKQKIAENSDTTTYARPVCKWRRY